MPVTVLRRIGRKQKEQKNPGMQEYFARLRKEKKIRPEDVAHDMKRSFSTIIGLKNGRVKPNPLVIVFLETTYKIPVYLKAA